MNLALGSDISVSTLATVTSVEDAIRQSEMKKPRSNTIEPVKLDGRTLEGGGQLLRNAICLSTLTGIPVKIHDIRGNRSSGGGLKAQHLACVNWLAHACPAKVEGAEKGSKTLLFEPGKGSETPFSGLSPAFKKVMREGNPVYECRLDIGTAGSTGLALQAVLPFILFSDFPSEIPVRLTLSGGTNVSGSPSYEYITQVLLPTLQGIGFPEIHAKLGKRGWSHGGSSIGNFTLEISPRPSVALPAFKLRPKDIDAKPSQPLHLQATIIAPSSCHDHFGTVLRPAIQHHFGKSFSSDDGKLDITCEGSLHEKRMYLILVATMPSSSKASSSSSTMQPSKTYKLGRDWLYDRKIRSHERSATEMVEYVANALANEIESKSYVDDHMRDQLVIFSALAQGRSEVFAGIDEDGEGREPTLHARTAEWVAKNLLGVKFDVSGGCEGVGFGAGEVDNPLLKNGQVLATAVEDEGFEEKMRSLNVR